MRKNAFLLILFFAAVPLYSCALKDTAAISEKISEEEVPAILLGAELPEDHQEVETPACMECHAIKTDAVSTATKRFLERKGRWEKRFSGKKSFSCLEKSKVVSWQLPLMVNRM